MKYINELSLSTVPVHNIIFAVTSPNDYDMSRVMAVEDWEDSYGSVAFLFGSHCSCYGFNESQWSATVCTPDEIKLLLNGWLESGTIEERQMAQLFKDTGRLD